MNKDHPADTAKKLDEKRQQEAGKTAGSKHQPADGPKHPGADKMHDTASDASRAVKLDKKPK